MVSRAMRGVPGLLAALVATGCFDVHSVDVGPLIIDDFEDNDLEPTDPSFEKWSCGRFPLPDDGSSCLNDPTTVDHSSAHSLYVSTTIAFPMDGTEERRGAFLKTIASKTKDLRRFSRVVFAVKLESGDPLLPMPTLEVLINCHLAPLITPEGQAAPDGDRYLRSPMKSPGGDWQILSADLGDFAVPQGVDGMTGPPTCLQFADNLRFEVGTILTTPGQSERLDVHVDDVELE
jgi:hypothetical protein